MSDGLQRRETNALGILIALIITFAPIVCAIQCSLAMRAHMKGTASAPMHGAMDHHFLDAANTAPLPVCGAEQDSGRFRALLQQVTQCWQTPLAPYDSGWLVIGLAAMIGLAFEAVFRRVPHPPPRRLHTAVMA